MKTNATDSVETMQTDVTDSVNFLKRRDGFSKIRADQGVGFGFYSWRRTCKCKEKADETKNARRNNWFFALTAIDGGEDGEVNAVEAVQEILEITEDWGAAKSVRPS